MRRRRCNDEPGFTLMEIMMATAIFAVVVGVTAISLSSFYVQMDIQEQRIEALQSCRDVMSALREKRHQYELQDDTFDWSSYLNWISGEQDEGWQEFLRQGEGHVELRDHALNVLILNMGGGNAAPGDNPLQIIVTSTWTDRQGRTLSTRLASVITSD